MKKALILILIISFFSTACTTSKKQSGTTTTSAPIQIGTGEFRACGILECADLGVPMDYKKPKGRKINIAMVKMPAQDPARKIGILLVNPGGPGASGIELIKNYGSILFSQDVKDQFDIIGWDPRGAGESTKVKCSNSLDFLFDDVDYTPDNQQEIAKLKKENKLFSQRCEKSDAELLPFLDTDSSVKDMDSIRKALGEKQINFLGFSYGSVLGQIYASKYPKNFRTMVIDGVVDVGADPVEISKEQTVGFEDSLNSFFEWCQQNGCKFSKNQNSKKVFQSIMADVDKTAVVSTIDPTVKLGPAQLDIAASYFLYSGTTGWQNLDTALVSLQAGNPDNLLDGFNSYVGRSAGGNYDGSYSSFLTIGCADGRIGNVDQMIKFSDEIKEEAPIFGQSGILLGLPCATWPKAKKAKAIDVNATGSAPIVVIGTTGDPSTPVQWARNAAMQLKTGVYIERRGEGHTAYKQGNACIDALVDKYFLTAIEPNSKVCVD